MIRIWQWGMGGFFFESPAQVPASATSRSCELLSLSNPARRLEELAHAAEFLVALLDESGGIQSDKIPKRTRENRIQQRSRGFMIQMRATVRFGNYFVNDTELAQIASRDFQGFRCYFRL